MLSENSLSTSGCPHKTRLVITNGKEVESIVWSEAAVWLVSRHLHPCGRTLAGTGLPPCAYLLRGSVHGRADVEHSGRLVRAQPRREGAALGGPEEHGHGVECVWHDRACDLQTELVSVSRDRLCLHIHTSCLPTNLRKKEIMVIISQAFVSS